MTNGTLETPAEEQSSPVKKSSRRVHFRLNQIPGDCNAEDIGQERQILAHRYNMNFVQTCLFALRLRNHKFHVLHTI